MFQCTIVSVTLILYNYNYIYNYNGKSPRQFLINLKLSKWSSSCTPCICKNMLPWPVIKGPLPHGHGHHNMSKQALHYTAVVLPAKTFQSIVIKCL